MAKVESTFDPNQLITGYSITYGDIANGGNCWLGMPAIILSRRVALPDDHDGYPTTIEEYEQYGAQMPRVIKKLTDVMIGCVEYQKLVAAGVDVQPCQKCPLNSRSEI